MKEILNINHCHEEVTNKRKSNKPEANLKSQKRGYHKFKIDHNFNIFGFKPDKKNVSRVLSMEVWDGATYETKVSGRNKDYFFVPDTGMIHFSRFFFLPARFASMNSPSARFGGGEFLTPIRISYVYGKNPNEDAREGPMVTELTKKIAAVEILRNSNFGETLVGGGDSVGMAQKVDQYQREIEDVLEMMRAFEVF